MSTIRFSPIPVLGLMLLGALGAFLGACSSSDDDGGTDPGNVFNRPPEVSEIEWANAYLFYVEDDLITLAVTATDADGDPLSYSWDWATAESAGSYDRDSTSQVVLTVGSTPGQYQARVSVTDGRSTPISRVVGISVGNRLDGGDITSNLTIAASTWPYVLLSDATVKSGATLLVEAGAEIQVRQRRSGASILNQGLFVEAGGTLDFAGSGVSPVILRGNKTGTNTLPVHKGIEVDSSGNVELRNFRILDGTLGVLKRGFGTAILQDGTISGCGTGYLGLAQMGGISSTVTVQDLTVRDCDAEGVSLSGSSGSFEGLTVRDCGGIGFKLTAGASTSSATIDRCELDGNEGGNLAVDMGSTVDLGCSNLLPAEGGYNVVFLKSGVAVGGVLPMVDCYWGIAAPQSQEFIRDETFDPEGRIDDTTWARESDLSGYRGSAINFNDTGDPCNP